ncbi:MAG: acetylglutamate kinase [Alphaproteobacteria bacterium]|nr:acetylglutamate kinase [Rhodobiaceae bacterium]MDC0071089.1 acetylglutamate kinase [Rhodobiaceae bacterium]MDC0184914.1 acetylglutamate kinase [Rhodobiaceae bacterium]|tara:strand:- start:6629 stop:7528 length:900 start_codon:yes stop_codon:yes gene_type:complete
MNKDKGAVKDWLNNADILTGALPYMQKYNGSIIVIKYGGNAMADSDLVESFCNDIVFLKQSGLKPVIVHGGGPQIGSMLERLGIKTKFESGMRITDEDTLEVVEMVLAGRINKNIASKINSSGGKAVGISGKDGSMIVAEKLTKQNGSNESNIEKIIDLGYVGFPKKINNTIIETLIKDDFIPIIAPLGIGVDGKTYNINADTAAGAIASSLKSKRLLILTDVEGVIDSNNNLLEEVNGKKIDEMIESGEVSGGMIPKLNTCLDSVNNGVDAAVIVDGRVKHAVLLELFTDHGAGTLVR